MYEPESKYKSQRFVERKTKESKTKIEEFFKELEDKGVYKRKERRN